MRLELLAVVVTCFNVQNFVAAFGWGSLMSEMITVVRR